MSTSSSQGVIEISVEETNRLRAELGLQPLRFSASTTTAAAAATTTTAAAADVVGRAKENPPDSNKSVSLDLSKNETAETNEMLTLSVAETNALRQRLGMAPLQLTDKPSSNISNTGCSSSISSATFIQHAPAVNLMHVQQAAERVEHAKLQRQVQENIRHQFATPSLGTTTTTTTTTTTLSSGKNNTNSNLNSTLSWAQQMRAQQNKPLLDANDTEDKEDESRVDTTVTAAKYDETDLQGLSVGHSVADLPEGSTTVLTLVDAPLLPPTTKTRTDLSHKVQAWNDDDEDELLLQQQPRLENVQLSEQQSQHDGLRAKRLMELGRGRAGGYSGLDDDEFSELGGTQAPSRTARHPDSTDRNNGTDLSTTATKQKKSQGFTIGTTNNMHEEQDAQSDLFTSTNNNANMAQGRAISLEPTHADVTASDFMTAEEQEEEEKAIAATKKKKKEGKFKKEKRVKKEKKKSKRRTAESDEEDADEDALPVTTKGLLEELEETAVVNTLSRKRRRADDEVADDVVEPNSEDEGAESTDQKRSIVEPLSSKSASSSSKRSRYDQVMAKGNQRSLQAFGNKKKPSVSVMMDEEPDDAFLNAALAKARRLVRLKELSEASKQQTKVGGADAVVAAVQQSKIAAATAASNNESTAASTGTITFAVDETREFTRALMARKTEQTERELARKNAAKPLLEKHVDATEVDGNQESKDTTVAVVKLEEAEEEDVDIAELAKQVREDDNGLDGATGQTVPIGRGLGGILNLLKQSGEITRKNAGKEEMRGRAKDKRTYEDYEPLDLSKVVTIDESKATGKDKEFANREIKLEYRDKHGRLLTRKEAFRELSYQFHGYGSGKRKEEKKLEQIAREQAEARLASRQAAEGAGAGTFGALKATQKATGKAFVVHKTGN